MPEADVAGPVSPARPGLTVSVPTARSGLVGLVSPGRPPELTLLGFDYGSRRVGVAAGNTVTGRAQPLTTIAAIGAARFDAIGRLIAEWQPAALVIGVPFHPDGVAHDNTIQARRFGRQLHGRFGLPVHEVDERYTTTSARSGGAGDLDAAAAAIILEQHLAALA